MAYTNFRNGFNIQTGSAVDRRLLMSKAEMKTAEDVFNLPDKYFCLCTDDGKFYLYDVNNVANEETGKYVLLDDTFEYSTPSAKANLDEAVANSIKTTGIVQAAVKEEVQAELADTKADGGLITE